MRQLLKPGQQVQTEASGVSCVVGECLGSGGQGEVYRVTVDGNEMALKWYYPDYISVDPTLRARLENAVKIGAPSDQFLWPVDLASADDVEGFGYVMVLCDGRFRSITELLKRQIEPSFRALATAGFEITNAFWQVHARGMCYRDISYRNVLLEPDTGEIRICDNDNVDVDCQPGAVAGTPEFMAPEIVRGEADPSSSTDLHSLAVLLFMILMVHHPLKGAKEWAIRSMDEAAMDRIYGAEPLFIFDPDDNTNAPVPGHQENPLGLWPLYPAFLRDLFTRAFTDGLRDPVNGRVQESEWRVAMVELRDSIFACDNCGMENFYDRERLRTSGGGPGKCWACPEALRLPYRIGISDDLHKGRRPHVVMLNEGTQIYPHHIDGNAKWDFSTPVGEVIEHPSKPGVWGLKNLSSARWTSIAPDGSVRDVDPGRAAMLSAGNVVSFGTRKGVVRD